MLTHHRKDILNKKEENISCYGDSLMRLQHQLPQEQATSTISCIGQSNITE